MGTLQIVGTSLGGHLVPDRCEALMGEEEGGEKGRQQEIFFPVTFPYILLHPLLLQVLLPVCPTPHASGYWCPFEGIPSQPFISRSWPQPGCKCAELFWQHFRINGKPFLQLVSIAVLIKLNSCGAHMDVICKSH